MASQPSSKPACTKRGVILTCYVDGKKRFRAMPVEEERPAPAPTLARPVTRTTNATNVSMKAGPSDLEV